MYGRNIRVESYRLQERKGTHQQPRSNLQKKDSWWNPKNSGKWKKKQNKKKTNRDTWEWTQREPNNFTVVIQSTEEDPNPKDV